MKLPVMEFIARFLEHVLPHRFVKIRHFGYFATKIKKQCLAEIKIQLKQVILEPPEKFGIADALKLTLGINIKKCQACKIGELIVYRVDNPIRGSPRKLPLNKTFA